MDDQAERGWGMGILIWLIIGGVIGWFAYGAIQAREDWPVAFSRASDFVPVHAVPLSAEVRRDWSRFGGEHHGRTRQEYRHAVWLDVTYQFDGRTYTSPVKYRCRMSRCGAEGNAHYAMQQRNWPLEVLVSRLDPSIVTTSTYHADRADEVYLRVGMISLIGLVWLFTPVCMLVKHQYRRQRDWFDADPPDSEAHRPRYDPDTSLTESLSDRWFDR